MRRLLGKHGFRTRGVHSTNIYLVTTKCQPSGDLVTRDSVAWYLCHPSRNVSGHSARPPSSAWRGTRACSALLPPWLTNSPLINMLSLQCKVEPCSSVLWNQLRISVSQGTYFLTWRLRDCCNSHNAVVEEVSEWHWCYCKVKNC